MQMRGNILALLRAGWGKLVSGVKIVIDPPPAAIGWYILGVLVIAIGGNVLFGSLFNSPKPATKPFALIRATDVVTTSMPPPPKSASPSDKPPLESAKKVKVAVPAPYKPAAAVPRQKLYRKKEAACSWPFC